MRENEKIGLKVIEEIADSITAPPPELTDDEKIKQAEKIAGGIHEPEKGKLEDLKVNSLPHPPDDPYWRGRFGGPATAEEAKKERAAMAAEKRKHQKKEGAEHEPGIRKEPGKPNEPIPPGPGKDPGAKPKRDYGPLI